MQPLLARRTALISAPALVLTRPAFARDAWSSFKARFLRADGRVVDTGNGGISHSEGQAYGLLFAEAHDDREAFTRILAWTDRTLRLPGSPLLAWRFDPRLPVPVSDPNNATDGDLVLAWALLRAATRWGEAAFYERAHLTAAALRSQCVRRTALGPVLLPGRMGFEGPAGPVTNPSYYVMPALRELERAFPSMGWAEIALSGHRLIERSAFGRWSLPADWVELRADGPVPWAQRPARFSFDAVRVPLNMLWMGRGDGPVAHAARFWSASHPYRPAWADLATAAISPYPAPAGIEAVARLSIAAAEGRAERAAIPAPRDSDDYYAAALVLKARLAQAQVTGAAMV